MADAATLWNSERGGGLPFNFDSDLGGQGSALDIGFSFDPLAATKTTRIEGMCKPALELLAFIGLQRFRPRELTDQNRFVYSVWNQPLPVSVAAAVGPFPRLISRGPMEASLVPPHECGTTNLSAVDKPRPIDAS